MGGESSVLKTQQVEINQAEASVLPALCFICISVLLFRSVRTGL